MATMTAPIPTTTRTPGGAFLITDATPADCFFPEDFTEEHRQIAQTTADFATNEILPASDAIEAKDFNVTRRLIREASELGLTSVDIPEEYGGLEMDKVTTAIIAENIAKQGSFSVAISAHTMMVKNTDWSSLPPCCMAVVTSQVMVAVMAVKNTTRYSRFISNTSSIWNSLYSTTTKMHA